MIPPIVPLRPPAIPHAATMLSKISPHEEGPAYSNAKDIKTGLVIGIKNKSRPTILVAKHDRARRTLHRLIFILSV